MRILIDECLDWRLCRALPEHDCVSVQRMGWNGLTNGALLAQAEQRFDIFITDDRNLSFQQAVSRFNIAVVVLQSKSTRLTDTIELIPELQTIIPKLAPGLIVQIGPDT